MNKLTICTGAVLACCGLALAVEPQGYAAHQTITFSGYTGSETLENFPVLLRLPATSFVQADHSDLAIVDAEGNLLPYEVDSVSEGNVLVWVCVPSLAGTETAVTAYFGKGTPDANAFTAADVWTGAYAAVWHMNPDKLDATGHELEQTTKNEGNLTAVSEALIGNALRLNASGEAGVWLPTPKATFIDQYISNYEQLTISGWIMPAKTTPGKASRLFCWKASTEKAGLDTFQNTDGKFYLRGGDKGTTTKTTAALGWSANAWHHLTAQFNGTTAVAYLDGQNLATEGSIKAVTVGDGTNVKHLGFGNMGGDGELQYPLANGVLDELRIYNGVASADWVKAEYDTVMTPTFAAYGEVVTSGDVEASDGVWISTAEEARWSDPANWQNGRLPVGAGATVTFASPATVAAQRIVMDNDVPVLALVQNDAVQRTIAGGRFAFLSAADITVAAGSLELAEPFYSGMAVKKGTGKLTFAAQTTIAGDFAVEGGEVTFAQAPSRVLVPAEDGTFTPTAALWVTHVGFVDAEGTQEHPVRVTVAKRVPAAEEGADPADTLVIQSRWVAQAPGFMQEDVRYQRLPVPQQLTAGQLYAALATGGKAARLIVAEDVATSVVNGTLDLAEGTTVSATTPVVSLRGLAGAGCLAAVTDQPVAFDLTQSSEGSFTGSTSGRVALIKRGGSRLSLTGTGLFPDGVTFRGGDVWAATAATVDPAAVLSFGDTSGANGCGTLTIGATGEISPAVAATRMTTTGLTAMGLAAAPGTTLTVRGATFSDTDRDVPIANGKSNEFALHAHAAETAADDPTLVLTDSTIAYLDLAARVDGRAGEAATRPANKIVVQDVKATDDFNRVRKFTVQNNTMDALGGTVEFRGESPFVTDWFDIVGTQTAVVQAPGSIVKVTNQMRFSDSTPSWEPINACDTDWTIGEGASLVVNGYPTNVQRGESSDNSVLHIDGGLLKMYKEVKEGTVLNLFPLAVRMPVVLSEKGGLVDLVPDQGGAAVPVRVYAPLTGVGPVTFTGDETLPLVSIAKEASHTGGTTAKAVTLELAAPLAADSDVALVDGAKLRTTAKTVRLGTVSATEASVEVETAAASDLWVKTFSGEAKEVTKTGAGRLGLLLAAEKDQPEMTLNVPAGTLAFSMGRVFNAPTLVSDGDFEPETAVGGPNAGDRDRRAKRDKTYFAANLTGWSFDSANDYAGIAVDGSYFTTNGQIANNGGAEAGNLHTAFLRSSGATAGSISRVFTTDYPNTEVTIVFDWNVRWPGDGKPYWAKIGVLVDEDQVYETEVLASTEAVEPSACAAGFRAWRQATVKVVLPSAGPHKLAFKALTPVVDGAEKLGEALLDNVRLGTSYAIGGVANTQLKNLTVNLSAGAKLYLDDGFLGKIGTLTYDGVKIRDTISAITQPDFVLGTGRLVGPRLMTIFIR